MNPRHYVQVFTVLVALGIAGGCMNPWTAKRIDETTVTVRDSKERLAVAEFRLAELEKRIIANEDPAQTPILEGQREELKATVERLRQAVLDEESRLADAQEQGRKEKYESGAELAEWAQSGLGTAAMFLPYLAPLAGIAGAIATSLRRKAAGEPPSLLT